MPEYGVKGCPVCAWRGTCVIKHRFEAGASQNCVEFTRDMTLKVDPSKELEEKSISDVTNPPNPNQS